jgi:hypothetical protein
LKSQTGRGKFRDCICVFKKKNSDTTNIKFILSKNNKCTVTNAH